METLLGVFIGLTAWLTGICVYLLVRLRTHRLEYRKLYERQEVMRENSAADNARREAAYKGLRVVAEETMNALKKIEAQIFTATYY